MHFVKAADMNAQVRRQEPWNVAVYALLSATAGFVVFLGPTNAQNQLLAWLVRRASSSVAGTLPNGLPPSLFLLGVVVVLLLVGSLRPPWHLVQQIAMTFVGAWLALGAFTSPTLRAEALILGLTLVILNLRSHTLSVPANYLVLITVAFTLAKNFSEVGASNVLVGAQWHLGLAFVASAVALYAVKLVTQRYWNM